MMNPRRVKYECKIHQMAKCICIRWDEQWNEEMNNEIVNPRGLSKGVKHTEWPSALAYDEINIHVIRGE